MRDVTERPEAVEAGTVRIVGAEKDTIVREANRLLDDANLYRTMSQAHNPYGDGLAAARICKVLSDSTRLH
jgi:UDP-N-acetylglucosamine 2-epimerase (non-hydrolysing)